MKPLIVTLSRTLSHFERLAAKVPDWPRVLVNNAGTPDLTAAAVKAGWGCVEPGYNTSFSDGNNMGVKAGRSLCEEGADLLLLNDDLEPLDGFFEAILESDADVTGALLLHGDGSINHAGVSVAANGITDHLGRGAPITSRFALGCPLVPAVTFAAVRIRYSLWEQLGGLDGAYYYGWEDTDFCLRALQAGATIRCERRARAVHGECGTRQRGGQHDTTNGRHFMSKWQGRIEGVLNRAFEGNFKNVEGV